MKKGGCLKLVAAAVVGCGLLLASCCLLPCLGRRVPDALTFQVKEGMTRDEVFAILGEPNERQPSRDGEELWGYYIQEFGCSAWMNPVYVRFSGEGKVLSVWCQ